jgi:hypothetical protein
MRKLSNNRSVASAVIPPVLIVIAVTVEPAGRPSRRQLSHRPQPIHNNLKTVGCAGLCHNLMLGQGTAAAAGAGGAGVGSVGLVV